jgi:predicted HTH transcriptional regulator
MTMNIPLGQAESQKLEFKAKDALKHLPNVSREVVAMLNSSGGEVWLGLGEEHGRAVRIDPIEHPDREINRLKDHFSDAIEPSPIAGEIDIKAVCCEGGTVLRVSVNGSKQRRPYDLREGTARHFLKRVDDRLRSMSRVEIFHEQSSASTDSVRNKAVKNLWDAQQRQRAGIPSG